MTDFKTIPEIRNINIRREKKVKFQYVCSLFAVELWLKRQTGGVFGCQGDSWYPLEATYVGCSGGESVPGHFIPHYMGVCVKYPGPEAPSCFLLKANLKFLGKREFNDK